MTVQLKGRLLFDRIEIEKHLGIEAKKDCLPMQPGDVKATYADIDDFQQANHQQLMKGLRSLLSGIWSIVDGFYHQLRRDVP